ncbi:MAG TPA: acyl-CoA dehydrogenase family protein, partial [Caulobacteraceae bacterium]
MPLILTEDQTMIQDAARGFLTEHAPVAELRRLRDTRDPDGLSRDLWRAFGEMGFAGVLIPEAHGGSGLGAVEAGVIAEEIGRTLAPSPFLSSAVLAARALLEAGSADQQAEHLPGVAAGERIVALAVDEGPKHAPARTALNAVRAGNGWRLDGAKGFVVDGHVADALVVVARTAGAPGEAEGLTLFLVDPKTAGLTVERTVMVDAHNAARIAFDNVAVGADAVLGEVDGGAGPLERVLDTGRAVVAAEMVEAGAEAFARTVDYLKTRKQFG